jgi:hypothetical protein
VTDAFGCTEEFAGVIGELGGPTISLKADSVDCFGNDNGKITVSGTGGTRPYFYQWSLTAGNDSVASGLAPGMYYVTVTDDEGCDEIDSAEVFEPTAIVLAATSIGTSVAQDTGSASVTASGGTPPYSYLWNDNNAQQDTTATGLAPGAYTVEVTDNNGCVESTTVDVAQLVAAAIVEQLKSQLNVYPLPANDIVHFSMATPRELVLVDMKGNVVKTVGEGESQIDVSQIDDGTYLLQDKSSGIFMYRVMVQH